MTDTTVPSNAQWHRSDDGAARIGEVPDQTPLPAPIASMHFSTRTIAAGEQFDAWHAAMEHSIDVTPDPANGRMPGFAADLNAWDLGGVGLVSMDMPGIGHERQWRNVRRPQSDDWSLMIPVRDGSGRRYAAREAFVSSIDKPFIGASSDTHVVSLFFARDMFPDVTRALDGRLLSIGDGGSGGLLIDLILSLQMRLEEGLSAHPVAIRNAIQAMTALAVAPSLASHERARGAVSALMHERIVRHINANLRSPELGTEAICKAFQMSRSSLYRLFESNGGVEAFIKRRRMEAIRDTLQGDTRRTVQSVAADYGYDDPSSFARSFKAQIGISPKDARNEGLPVGDKRVRPSGAFDIFLQEIKA